MLTGVPTAYADGTTGTLTASYVYDAATGAGTISYSYTLLDNTSGNNTSASFAVVVTDADGDPAPAGNLVINIVDDVPTAHADTDSVATDVRADAGNVRRRRPTCWPATSPAPTARRWSALRAAGTHDVGGDSAGTSAPNPRHHGTLTLNADGSYSYRAMPARPAA